MVSVLCFHFNYKVKFKRIFHCIDDVIQQEKKKLNYSAEFCTTVKVIIIFECNKYDNKGNKLELLIFVSLFI